MFGRMLKDWQNFQRGLLQTDTSTRALWSSNKNALTAPPLHSDIASSSLITEGLCVRPRNQKENEQTWGPNGGSWTLPRPKQNIVMPLAPLFIGNLVPIGFHDIVAVCMFSSVSLWGHFSHSCQGSCLSMATANVKWFESFISP